jgi:membrane-associated protease RseP (regulator of RpoE activity)
VAYVLGIALFALGILVSVSLHEFGHMLTAKRFGMTVTRYFIGYGPTLFSFRRGGTEYGLKAIPLGGFAKIQGMTTLDEFDGEDGRPMWTFPLWKRTVVMAGGPIAHFAFGFVLLWIAVSFVGVPNPELAKPQPAVITVDAGQPAARAGLHDGDRITALNGKPIANWDELLAALGASKPGPATVDLIRDGQTVRQTVDLAAGPQRPMLGVHFKQLVPDQVRYGPVRGIGVSAQYAKDAVVGTGAALAHLPQRIPGLWAAVTGQPRDAETPISMVGASQLGGESAAHGQWSLFLLLLASLNFFVGLFNLLPLLPFDGGHIAVWWFERIRSTVYARLRHPDPGRVDYLRLAPVTYAVILVAGAFTLLTIAADLINPVRMFS